MTAYSGTAITVSEKNVIAVMREGGVVGGLCYAASSASYTAGTILMRNSSSAELFQPWDGTVDGSRPVAGVLLETQTLDTTPEIFNVGMAGNTYNNKYLLVAGSEPTIAELAYIAQCGFHLAGGGNGT